MNQKKAKSIRRTMRRLFGRDPREVVTKPKKAMQIQTVVMGWNGPQIKTAIWTGQHALDPLCGRAEYQKMKREYKDGQRQGKNLLGPSRLYFPAELDARTAA